MIRYILLFDVTMMLFLFIVSCNNPSISDPVNESVIDLTGTWRSSYGWNGEEGTMILKQTGDSIRGRYTFQNGQLEGILLADSFPFKWWEYALSNCPYDCAEQHHRGPGFFKVNNGGDSLFGKWCNEGDQEWSPSDWVAVRISKTIDESQFSIDTITSPSAPLTGMWYSEWGDILLTQVGDSVHGIYRNEDNYGRIAGKLVGLRFSLSWWEGQKIDIAWNEAQFRGYGECEVSEDGARFDGFWRDENSKHWVDNPLWGEKFSEEVDSSSFFDDSDSEDDDTDSNKTIIPSDPGLYLSSDPSNELLFMSKGDDGSALFFHGTEEGEMMKPTHVIYRDNHGVTSVIILHDLMPVQWVLDTISVAVYNIEGTLTFDPTKAFHVIRHGTEEIAGNLDIYPSSLLDVITGIETVSEETYDHVRDFLSANNISDFKQLNELAQSSGPDQPLYIRAATGMSIAAASLALGESEKNGALSKSTKATILTQGLFKNFVKIAASWLANMLADKYGPDFSGTGPTVGVLLCQGAAKYGVCHYMFFKSTELNQCVTLCQTSMGCFTNICMPMDIDVEMAGSFGGSQFGGN